MLESSVITEAECDGAERRSGGYTHREIISERNTAPGQASQWHRCLGVALHPAWKAEAGDLLSCGVPHREGHLAAPRDLDQSLEPRHQRTPAVIRHHGYRHRPLREGVSSRAGEEYARHGWIEAEAAHQAALGEVSGR